MRFYEFESKQVLKKNGIPVVDGGTAASTADATKIAQELGGAVVVKAQVLSPAQQTRARRDAASASEAGTAAGELLAVDDGGRKPRGVLVEKRIGDDKSAAFSLACTYDGVAKRPVMIAATLAGNVDELADTHPDRVFKRHFSALYPFSPYLAKELASDLGLKGADGTQMTAIISKLAQLFLKHDLTQANISRLVRTGDGTFVSTDCYMDLEVEARTRQKALLQELGIAVDDKRLVREPTAFEAAGAAIDAEDPRGVAGPVVEFDGSIGLVIGAGGGSLTISDAVRRAGGKPANYAALGGNPSVRKTENLTKLVLSKPGVTKIAVISNVVSNTRADLVARGVIKGVKALGFEPRDKIAVFRVPGAWEADAVKILEKYGIDYCDRTVSISEAAKRAVQKIG